MTRDGVISIRSTGSASDTDNSTLPVDAVINTTNAAAAAVAGTIAITAVRCDAMAAVCHDRWRWQMAGGPWPMADGDGRWEMGDGGWEKEDDG